MTVTATPAFPQIPASIATSFNNATGTAVATLFTAGTNGSLVDCINISSTDTSAHDVQFWVNTGGSDILIGTVNCPIGAGNTSGVPAINALGSGNSASNLAGFTFRDPAGNYVFYLAASAVLKVLFPVAITSGKTVYITGSAENF